MTEIKKLATFLKVSYDAQQKSFDYVLPIQKLYDITVKCKIIITKHALTFLVLATNVTMYDEDYDYVEFEMVGYTILQKNDATEYVSFVTKIFEIIQEWKFDLLSGKLLPPEKFKLDVSIFETFRDLPHVKMMHDKCSVCHEMTKNKTGCGHSLCILCWDKIDFKDVCSEDCDDCETFKPCPVCRGKMEHK